MPRTERLPQQPGESSHRECTKCHNFKPIADFYPRRTTTPYVSTRKPGSTKGRKLGVKGPKVGGAGLDGGNVGTRMSFCIVCNNLDTIQRVRLKRLRTLTLEQLQEEQTKHIAVLADIGRVMMEVATRGSAGTG